MLVCEYKLPDRKTGFVESSSYLVLIGIPRLQIKMRTVIRQRTLADHNCCILVLIISATSFPAFIAHPHPVRRRTEEHGSSEEKLSHVHILTRVVQHAN
jgi:hypothetical protein